MRLKVDQEVLSCLEYVIRQCGSVPRNKFLHLFDLKIVFGR